MVLGPKPGSRSLLSNFQRFHLRKPFLTLTYSCIEHRFENAMFLPFPSVGIMDSPPYESLSLSLRDSFFRPSFVISRVRGVKFPRNSLSEFARLIFSMVFPRECSASYETPCRSSPIYLLPPPSPSDFFFCSLFVLSLGLQSARMFMNFFLAPVCCSCSFSRSCGERSFMRFATPPPLTSALFGLCEAPAVF